MMQVLEGGTDMDVDYIALVLHYKEPHERFEYEDELDLQVFEKITLMEEPLFIEYLEAIRDAMIDIKDFFLHFISDRNHLFEL